MRRRAALLAPLVLALSAAPAHGQGPASLPSGGVGQRPGPEVLYTPPPEVPQLELQAPFAAQPLLVSGTDALRDGEYLYQDYLFDDHGADTVAPSAQRRESLGFDAVSSTAGDVSYPSSERFAGNAADIVEVRIRPTADAVVMRVTLNSVVDPEVPVVGVGIDADGGGGQPVDWPLGAGVASPGLDAFVTAHGDEGLVHELPGGASQPLPEGAVVTDARTNQMTITVPREVLDPGTATWRLVAGAGLWDPDAGAWRQVPAQRTASADEPASGNPVVAAPAVFNLAFRFDEPQQRQPAPPATTATFPGIGNWFEDAQARELADGVIDEMVAEVDFAKLAAQAGERLHDPEGDEQARVMPSRLNLPEGVRPAGEFPRFGGRLQPYLLTVPPGYDPARPAPLTFTLHSLGGTYTQYAVFSPTQLEQLGDQRGSLVVSPLAHGTDGWYQDEAEFDVFEAWADVARHFALDPERVAITGYSMGGYGSYKLGANWPDLFGRAFTAVGPPGEGVTALPGVTPPTGGADTLTTPLLGNLRWVPFLNWVALQDELVPYSGPVAQQSRFDALGLRSELWTFQGEHFTLALQDQWGAARDFLGQAPVIRDPPRVTYGFFPSQDRPALGLVHDHAYWVSGLRARDTRGDSAADPPRGEIDARSLAFGQGDPVTEPVSGVRAAGVPTPAAVRGTRWRALPARGRDNALEVDLDNVAAGTLTGARARLRGDRPLRVTLRSDGAGRLRLDLPFAPGTTVERVDGSPVVGAGAPGAARAAVAATEVALSGDGATFTLAAGQRTYRFAPTGGGAQRPTAPDGSEGGDDGGPAGDEDVSGTRRGGGDAGAAPGDGDSGDGGALPFTGATLGLLVLGGGGALAAGLALRRRARRA